MKKLTRRVFLEDSILAAAAAAAACSPVRMLAGEKQDKSVSDRINVAVLGVRSRGEGHAKAFAKRADCEVTYICDPDEAVGMRVAKSIGEIQGRTPRWVQDLRHVYDDKSVDAVSIASPNHWHALSAIWAMQAGKDVYVEKPVSHSVVEGRRIVEAARRYDRICQAGTQSRSKKSLAAAFEYIRAGKLGDVRFARCLTYKRRRPIGPAGKYSLPSSVDYNLWAGPAPMSPITRPRFHYDWHWFWDYGDGDLGNSSIHRVDVARWGLGVTDVGVGVMSYGGRVGYTDAGETPNTQVTIHDFGDKTIVQEVRGLETKPHPIGGGTIFVGSEGYLAGDLLFSPKGEKMGDFSQPHEDHFANFIKAVRSRKREDLNADILEGHLSSALCHLGNISHRLGEDSSPAEIRKQLEALKTREEALETFEQTREHLRERGVDMEKTRLTLGPWLRIDPTQESFVSNSAADKLLTVPYRAPFVMPDASQI